MKHAWAPSALTAMVGGEPIVPALVMWTGPFDWLVLIERQRS
jgi:hypothetical protein